METFRSDESVQAKMDRALEDARSRHPNALVQIVITGTARETFIDVSGKDVNAFDAAAVLVESAARLIFTEDPERGARAVALSHELFQKGLGVAVASDPSGQVRAVFMGGEMIGQSLEDAHVAAAGPDWSGEPERMLRKRAPADAFGVTPPRDGERED